MVVVIFRHFGLNSKFIIIQITVYLIKQPKQTMYNTPGKSQTEQFSSLREKIQSKLSTDKKRLESKDNLSKRYQNSIKRGQLDGPFSNLKQQKMSPQNKQYSGVKQSSVRQLQDTGYQQKISEKNILEFESLQNRNFYGYKEWIEFNKKYFCHVQQKDVKSLWKILRVINYGDVFIPSGLIYEVSKVLIISSGDRQKNLKSTFNQFLKLNKVSDQVQSFRQLKMYPSLEQLQMVYKKLETEKSQSIARSKNKSFSSAKNLNYNNNVFQRVYEDSKSRFETKNANIYRKLVKKTQGCAFKPEINQYNPYKLFTQQTLRPQRICHSKQKWRTKTQDQNVFSLQTSFKATEFDRGTYETIHLSQIPGVSKYIQQKKHSEAQKRKIQRYLAKPTLCYKHY